MKLAILLPGYLDSPDYHHMKFFDEELAKAGYIVERLDPCHLWETGNVDNYSITNYLAQIKETIEKYKNKKPEEIILVGHSMGGFTAIVAGGRFKEVTKIVSLCPPPDRKEIAHAWKNKQPRHSVRELPDNPGILRTFDIPYAFAEDGLQYSASEEVKNIKKPIMIFIGLKDKTVPPELTEKIVANANNAYVVREPEIGHDFRYSKKETEIVMNHIGKFLEIYK
jgi:pimeloyl-ACP methyl ester carboxylesterase